MQSTPFVAYFSIEWWFLLTAFFALGAIIGSFLNVVIHRLPLEESIVFPNSHCPQCGQAIAFYDNVPIVSWLILKGQCRNCRVSIPSRYLLVELLTGLTFAAFFWLNNVSPILPINFLFGAAIVALIFIDAEHMILPNAITYPGLIVALVVRLFLPLLWEYNNWFDDLSFAPFQSIEQPLWVKSIVGAILGATLGGGSLWLIGFLWKQFRGIDAMGLGDVKMMLMVGAYLGWRLTILSIFIGAFTGAIVGIGLIQKSGRDYQTHIPFGIFLGFGSLISLLFGSEIIGWYLSTFMPE